MTPATNLTRARSSSPATRSRSTSVACPDSQEKSQFSMSACPLRALRRSLRACYSWVVDCSASQAPCAGNYSPDSAPLFADLRLNVRRDTLLLEAEDDP